MGARIHLLYNRQVIRNQRGFTLTEVILVAGLVGVVVLGNLMIMNNITRDLGRIEKESMEESELAIVSKTAVNIMKRASLSFNRLNLPDDSNRNFFDYYPDLATTNFTETGRQRSLTMQAKDLGKYFYLISSEESDFDSLVFDPAHSYEVVSTPPDILLDGVIRYRGLNSPPYILGDNGAMASKKLMSQVYNDRWANGKIFVLTCPTYLREFKNNTISLATVPKTASFIGKVAVDDLSPVRTNEAVVDIVNTHPVTGNFYNSLDEYFRSLPTVGGAAPFVKIEPAQLIRFTMKANSTYGVGYADLYLQKWTNGKFDAGVMVADKIKSVKFVRESVTLPLVSMEIEK